MQKPLHPRRFDFTRNIVQSIIPTMDATTALSALAALAHETRLRVFRMLVEQPPEGLPAGIIAERAGVPPSSLTFHLHHLLQAGLVTQRRAGRQLFYAANHTAMTALVAYLTENCCGLGMPFAPACNPPACNPPACNPPACNPPACNRATA